MSTYCETCKEVILIIDDLDKLNTRAASSQQLENIACPGKLHEKERKGKPRFIGEDRTCYCWFNVTSTLLR